MKIYLISLFLLIAGTNLLAQENAYSLIKKQFESFEYENVIKTSDQLIAKGGLSDSLLIDLYTMRSVVFYSTGNEQLTRRSFDKILKLKKNYIPDPSQISPKLISLFEEVKSDFIRNNPEITVKKDSTAIKQELREADLKPFRTAVFRNILAPGTGQLSLGNSAKGWIITSVSTVSLAAMIYSIFNSRQKENSYMQEVDPNLFQPKYNEYNSAYKIRNAFIISYALIWVYSQIDLLLSSGEQTELQNKSASLNLEMNRLISGYQVNLRMGF